MIFRILIAGVLGGIVLFGWGAFAHMVLQLDAGMKGMPREDEIVGVMRDNITEPGIYFFPWGDTDSMTPEAETQWKAKYRRGPSGLLIYSPSNEKDPMTPAQLGTQLGIDVMLAILAAMLLAQAAPAMPQYIMRVFFVLLIGLIAGIAVPLPYWNWYGFPADFTRAAVAEQVLGYTLAGLVIAAIVRKPAAPAAMIAPTPAPVPASDARIS